MKHKAPRSVFNNPFSIAVGVLLIVAGGSFAAFEFFIPSLLALSVDEGENAVVRTVDEHGVETVISVAPHLKTPEAVKAIYMSQCVVGTPSFRESLVELIDTTELNAVVIDIKDYTGRIAFVPQDPALKDWASPDCGARDMRDFIAHLHEKNIYVIGRITVFQDPYYTKAHPELAVQSARTGSPWKDRKGLSFIQVGAKQYWDDVVKLSKESYAIGFDELNFDYIRFPSDGDMTDARYTLSLELTKAEALEEFFAYLHEKLKDEDIVMSADLFGMTATNTDDLNIGQVLERALPYFDYIDPMVYPSHYPEGFNGYKNVNEYAYEIVKFSMDEAVRRTLSATTPVPSLTHTRMGTSSPALYSKPVYDKYKIRPWLQSFDYPVHYTPLMVEEQIKATYDAGLNSYLFWDPANKYLSLKKVLGPQ